MKQQSGYYFRRLSLTQQVLLIILVMLTVLSLFFTFVLSANIDATISGQMYSMMKNNQARVISALESDEGLADNPQMFYFLTKDATQTTGLIVDGNLDLYVPSEDAPGPGMLKVLLDKAAKLEEEGGKPIQASYQDGDILYYYRLAEVPGMEKPTVLVSYMTDSYADMIRNSLVDSTMYITIIAFFLMLLLLMAWVFSIIRPLNQIKNYIAAIKQGKEVELNLNRSDEIGELANELSTMKDELTRQEKAKEDMIHNISHDLKTPIATIKSYSEAIKDGIYPYGTLERSVDVIIDNAERLEKKVHSLLYLNRVEYLVTSDAEGVVTNMKECVDEVVLNNAVIRPEIRVETDLEEVFFDGLLESWRVCVENIMENALRYAETYIKIVLRENDLRIYNNGIKMDESRVESLFAPFAKGEGGRFGLGLSIVKKVTSANHYKVEGYNTDDGVCFRIWREPEVKRDDKYTRLMNNIAGKKNNSWD